MLFSFSSRFSRIWRVRARTVLLRCILAALRARHRNNLARQDRADREPEPTGRPALFARRSGQCICRLPGVARHLRIHIDIDNFQLQVFTSIPDSTERILPGCRATIREHNFYTSYISAFVTGPKFRLRLNSCWLDWL
jgi:hypothetical protein